MSRIDFVTGAPEKYMPLVEELATLPDRLATILNQLNNNEFRQSRDPEWSPARILNHMISYAKHNGEFINQMAWMTDPTRREWDEESEQNTQANSNQLLQDLRNELSNTIKLLSHTPDAQWGRPGSIGNYGRRSLRQQLRSHIEHLNDHIDQIEQIVTNN
ncbi:MAG: hypothetical protein CL792_04755 [Chloroflexi bacterium]|nr:hypothetical protein [Chloroflexota bacterium]|tara:strand:+ start:18410 stop:18889 length:480 start_codon:yes stop_codon:yes gene_type:complete